jgi:hypothetical protein
MPFPSLCDLRALREKKWPQSFKEEAKSELVNRVSALHEM